MRRFINLVENAWSRQTAQATMDAAPNGWEAVEKILLKQGFKLLSKGSRAFVYANPKYPYVIKIFRHDACYENFVAFAMANPNKHYPTFRGKLLSITDNGDFRLIRIERLMRANDDDQVLFIRVCDALRIKKLLMGIPELPATASSVDEFMWQASHGVESVHSMDHLKRKLAAVEEVLVAARARNRSFVAALEALFEKVVTNACRCDYAADNVMQREDGTLVITDPLAPGGA